MFWKRVVFCAVFEVQGSEQVPIDGIDKRLGCLRLLFQPHERTMGTTSSSKQCGLILIEIIRGLVNIIAVDV